jgi:hypothetical protein
MVNRPVGYGVIFIRDSATCYSHYTAVRFGEIGVGLSFFSSQVWVGASKRDWQYDLFGNRQRHGGFHVR